MSTALQKSQYLQQVQATMSQIGDLADRAATLAQIFSDRAYDAAAADPVTAPDLADFGVLVYDLGVAINLLQAFVTLVSGDAAHRTAVNKWRSV